MSSIAKFVAFVLLLATVALPAAALSACWTNPGGSSGMKCPDGCPMMAQQASVGDRVTAESKDGSCCKISSGSRLPAAVPQVPVNASQAGGAPVKVIIPMSLPTPQQRRASAAQAPTPDTSPQAVLCTFLI